MPDLVRILNLAGQGSIDAALRIMERNSFITLHGGEGEGAVQRRARVLKLTAKGRSALGIAQGLPLLGSIPAGLLSEAIPEAAEEIIDPGTVLPWKPGDFLLRVRGDSMTGAGILDGDLVLLRPNEEPVSGQIAAVGVGEEREATLKRVFLEKGRVRLRAANPAFPDVLLPRDAEVRIAGVFKGLVRKEAFMQAAALPHSPFPAAEVCTPPKEERLAALRQTLAERFPAPGQERHAGCWPTGLAALDGREGGIRRGTVTEIASSPAGGALLLHLLLESTVSNASFAALVDCGGTFDPEGCADAALERMLWVRCPDAAVAVRAADLLLRDGSLPLVLMDFQAAPPEALARTPASVWHRFQRLTEQSAAALVILTRRPVIESAQVRIAVNTRWTLAAQRRGRGELLHEMQVRVMPRRSAAAGGWQAVSSAAELKA